MNHQLELTGLETAASLTAIGEDGELSRPVLNVHPAVHRVVVAGDWLGVLVLVRRLVVESAVTAKRLLAFAGTSDNSLCCSLKSVI